MLIYGTAIVLQQVKIADLRQSLANLRADAWLVNQENICFRMLYGPYTPHDQMTDECAELGIDIKESTSTTTYRFIGEEPHERPQSHP
jgi:hypothetical protein